MSCFNQSSCIIDIVEGLEPDRILNFGFLLNHCNNTVKNVQ